MISVNSMKYISLQTAYKIYFSPNCIQNIFIFTLHTKYIYLHTAYKIYLSSHCIQNIFIFTLHTKYPSPKVDYWSVIIRSGPTVLLYFYLHTDIQLCSTNSFCNTVINVKKSSENLRCFLGLVIGINFD